MVPPKEHTEKPELDATPHDAAPDATRAEEASSAAPAQPADASFKELSLRNDALQREVRKWTKMYEDLRETHQSMERSLRDRIDEARRSETAARDEIREIRARLQRSEASYRRLIDATQAAEGESETDAIRAQLMALVESHSELSRSLDALFHQLQQKGEALEAMTRARQEAEQRAEGEIQRMEQRLKGEQEIAARAVAQFHAIEEAHQQLVRAYRDMNDRFIRLHQQVEAATSSGKTRSGDSPPRISLNR